MYKLIIYGLALQGSSAFYRRKLAFLFLMITGTVTSVNGYGQQGMYIAPGSNFYVHGDTVGVFTNVFNNGNFGSDPFGVIRLMGLMWTNDTTSTFPDEGSYAAGNPAPIFFNGKGGLFWFDNSVVSSPAYGQIQFIQGGYTVLAHRGPAFPNLQVDNMNGVWLSSATSDARVRNILNFKNGKLYLNGNNILIGGGGGPGMITNYSESKYIVTGNTITGGGVYRGKLNTSAGQVFFPVGADANYYTPAEILYKGTAQDFKVRAFNQVYNHAVSGTTGNQDFVQTTWNISKENNEVAEADIALQHPQALEGSVFAAQRNVSYITRYDTGRKVWDTIPGSTPVTPGNLTTGVQLNNTFVNIRNFTLALSPNEYVSKSAFNSNAQLGLAKNVDNVTRLANGTFNVAFTFVVQNKNQGQTKLTNLSVSDNLATAFTTAMTCRVVALTSTGTTFSVNTNYTGIGADTTLLLPGSWLAPQQTDTIHLLVNIDAHRISGTFYNTAYGSALNYELIVTAVSANGLNPDNNPSKSPVVINSPIGMHIPGGFSPNNDGVNDRFVIGNILNYNVKVEMFNRWGNKVYDSKGYYQNDWDGTCNQAGPLFNNKLPKGTYYYIITAFDRATGVLIEKSIGFITLNR